MEDVERGAGAHGPCRAERRFPCGSGVTPSDSGSGTYTATLIVEEDLNGEITTLNEWGSGTYTVPGSTLTLDSDDEPVTGVFSGDQISLMLQDDDLGAVVLVFRK